MSTDPTAAPTADTSAPVDGLAAFLTAQRATLAWVMIALGVASGAAGVFCASRLMSAPAVKAADKDKEADPTAPEKPDVVAPPVPYRTEYLLGVFCGVLGTVAGVGVGAWVLAAPAKPTAAGRATDARVAALVAGGAVGLVLMAGGLLFFIVWFDLLVKWVDTKTAPAGAWKVATALLVFLAGAGLAFLAAQPARAEERNSPATRRLVYGLNFALGVLLLLVVLVAGNAVAALKVPAKLDTTESGFYTLAEPTTEYLRNLTEPVTATVTIPDGGERVRSDARRLVAECQAVNPSMFQVRYLSDSLNRSELTQLKAKYPSVDFDNYGILLTAGDGARFAYVREDELLGGEPDATGRSASVFLGESKLVQALLSITESKTRPVIYFTQASGELAVSPGREAGDPLRSASQLKAMLEKGYADVRTLAAGPADTKVPDDASVVVVADPTRPLPETQVAAIRDFVTGGAKPDAKKGKLVVLAGTHAGLDGKVTATGLEPVLAPLGVKLGTDFVYSAPGGRVDPTTVLAAVSAALVNARNPLALSFRDFPALPMENVRLTDVSRAAPGGPTTAEPLLYTTPGRLTWLEPTRTDPVAFIADLRKLERQAQNDALVKRQATDEPRPIAALVSEGTTSRAVVFGTGEFFSDDTGRRARSTAQAELFAAAVNWLRERPPAANIATKKYGVYTLGPDVGSVRLVWLPVGVTLTGVLAVGLGVALLRRMS